MTLEEEKKLVAEKLLGREYGIELIGDTYSRSVWRNKKGSSLYYDDWNPQSNREPWPEIWQEMSYQQMRDYSEIYDELMEIDGCELDTQTWVHIHTAPPDICWKALIKTLKEDE